MSSLDMYFPVLEAASHVQAVEPLPATPAMTARCVVSAVQVTTLRAARVRPAFRRLRWRCWYYCKYVRDAAPSDSDSA